MADADKKCPGCQQPLKDTAKAHCLGRRGGVPCGWVICKCGTHLDIRGYYFPRKVNS